MLTRFLMSRSAGGLMVRAWSSRATEYTRSHEWVTRRESGLARMGITDYAQRKLGEIAYVELPEVGNQVELDDVVVVLESTKAAGEIMMPITGEVVEVNEALNDAPELVNSDPDGDGWIVEFKFDPENESELEEKLLNREEYDQLVEEESKNG